MEKRNHNFKGGSITSHGYKMQYVGKDHHLADVRGYAYEHRLEAENKLGRRLLPTEEVHHDNEIRLDNSHDNLIIAATKADHLFHHRKPGSNLRTTSQPNELIDCGCGCGKKILQFDNLGRPRRFVSGHNNIENRFKPKNLMA